MAGPRLSKTPQQRRLLLVTACGCAIVAALVGLVWRIGGERAPVNVLVITLDTLRADHVGSYGYGPARTPALDELAARGARFDQAITVVPLTLPAHTALFTGTFPAFNGIRDNGGFYVDDARTTMAEVLRARGYRTGAFVGSFVLDARWGLGQGFDTYFDEFDLSGDVPAGMDMIQRSGRDVVDRALAWLGEPSASPFFAWVHLYDPHAPYDAPEPYRSMYPASLVGAYDAEVAWTDAQVGRLIAALKADSRLDHTLVVVLGDHGESLGQHREQAHGFFIYDSVLRIPFIMAGPDVPVRTVTDQVRIVDVLPTVLELVGAEIPGDVQGTSLGRALHGERIDLLALSESWYPRYHYGWSELTAVRDGRYKFILAPRPELYDLAEDPGETTNLAAGQAARAQALERALAEMLRTVASAQRATAPQQVDPEVEERLRALGYVGSSPSARHLEDRPRGDPKDKIELYNLLKLAGTDVTEGRLEDAAQKVTRVLADDPDIIEGHTQLGNIHSKAQRHREAVEAYKKALALDPEHRQAAFSLALAYKALGLTEEAAVGFERARELDPRSGRSHFQIAELRMAARDFAGAARALEDALTLHVDRAPFLVKLGEAYIELKRWDDAEKVLNEALGIKPDVPRAQFNLGLIYDERRQSTRAAAAYEAELAHNPASYGAAFNLAKLLLQAGQLTPAIQRLRASVEAKPDFAEGHLYLAKALLDASDLREAEVSARRGLALGPSRGIAPLGHYVLADIYTRLGREREAARELAAARTLERGG